MKQRGLSEIISTFLVIVIVIAGMGIYVAASQQRILGDSVSVKEAISLTNDQTSELLEYIDMFKETSGSNTEIVRIFMYNYGLKNMTITNVYLNGTEEIKSNSYHVLDLNGLNFTNKGIIQTNVLPKDTSSELILNFTSDYFNSSQIKNIVMKTDSNKFIEIINKTK